MNSCKKYLLDLLEKSDNVEKSENSDLTKKDVEMWATKIIAEDNFPHYLENKSYLIIQQEIKYVCIRENINDEKILNKLGEYRYVDKICDLVRGKFVRWIRLPSNPVTLTNGGIVADIKFLENGIHILIKNALNRFIQYKYDECITFQKLSVEELLYLKI